MKFFSAVCQRDCEGIVAKHKLATYGVTGPVYGGVSPLQGQLDWSLSDKMNTAQMTAFLSQVSQAHPQEFIVIVVDGARSHKGKELVVPEDDVRLIPLPACLRSTHLNSSRLLDYRTGPGGARGRCGTG